MSLGSGLSSGQVTHPSLSPDVHAPGVPAPVPLHVLVPRHPGCQPSMCQPRHVRPPSPWDHTCLPTKLPTWLRVPLSPAPPCRSLPSSVPRKVFSLGQGSVQIPPELHMQLFPTRHCCRSSEPSLPGPWDCRGMWRPSAGQPRPDGQAPPSHWADEMQ